MKTFVNNNKNLLLTLLWMFAASAGIVKANQRDTSSKDIFSANRLLAKTINIGYAIDDTAKGPAARPVTTGDLLQIKKAGFTAVRLPIQWITAMPVEPPYQINRAFLKQIDQLVKFAVKIKLAVIIDNQADEQLMNDPERFKNRYLALWQQLSVHYKAYPMKVMFELMAEPHGKMEPYWPEYLKASLALVRLNNPDRPVIIGPTLSNRPQMITKLILPEEDRHIIVTFHQYSPIKFTMQGETWFPFGKPWEWIGTQWPVTPQDEQAITQMMNAVAAWSAKNNRPVFMGEFGVTLHADTVSAVRWIKFNREQAEKHDFSWGYWSSFGLTFSIFNLQTNTWRKEYLDALMAGDG